MRPFDALSVGRVSQEVERQPFLSRLRPVRVTQIANTATDILTAADDTDVVLQSLFASNVTGSPATLTLNLVPPSGSESTANTILASLSVAANTTVALAIGDGLLIEPGYTLSATGGTNNAINIVGSALERIGGEA